MKKLMISLISFAVITACSESEFSATEKKEAPESVAKKGKGAAGEVESEDLIESANPYRPLGVTVGGQGDVIGEGGSGGSANAITSVMGSTAVTKPGIDSSSGSTVALDVYFIDPAGATKSAAISVTNSEAFKFGWKSINTTSCKVYVKKKTDAGLGTESTVTTPSGVIDQARILVDHTFTASCLFKGPGGVEDKIEKGLDANVDGGWFNALKLECTAYCSGLGKRNTPSPEGFSCASGEERPSSSIGVVNFAPTGCWHSCAAPEGQSGSVSVGQRCYHPTQKRDNDSTDWTTGCYCKT